MHPNTAFQTDDRALHEALIAQIGFGMIFVQTPDGPRVAHRPMASTGEGAVRFHLLKDDPLVRHLDGATALAVLNGPSAYVSPRWYEDRGSLPTWNYIALELEGRVRLLPDEELADLLGAIAARGEGLLGGSNPWQPGDVPPATWDAMFGAITGFELTIEQWRPTFKLSQNKSAEDRERVADALGEEGNAAMANMMRVLAP